MSLLHPEILIKWGVRREDARECAVRLARMFESLRAIDPLFWPWHFRGFPPRRSKQSLSAEPPGLDVLTAAFEKGKNYYDRPRAPIPELGYTLGGGTQRTGNESVSFLMSVGAWNDSKYFANNVGVEQDWFCKEQFALTSSEIFGAAMRAMVIAWDADYGIVSDRGYVTRFLDSQEGRRLPPFWSGWIVYLASRFAEHVVPPPQAFVEAVPGHGVMIYATRETFDLDNPAHVAAADAILAALAPIQGMVQSKI